MLVAVPAHNEAATIQRCIASIDLAADQCGDVDVTIVVAADRCRDGTVDQLERFQPQHAYVNAIAGRWRGVGAVRAAAIAAYAPGADTWIANTDADCVVPENWLQRQLVHAADGIDLVAGAVDLEPAGTPPCLLRRFHDEYTAGPNAGRHVHAANLGIRADAYHALGGWSPHSIVGEEHRLWHAAIGRFRTIHDDRLVVLTSSRVHSRVIGGFASHLYRLTTATDDGQRNAHVAARALNDAS